MEFDPSIGSLINLDAEKKRRAEQRPKNASSLPMQLQSREKEELPLQIANSNQGAAVKEAESRQAGYRLVLSNMLRNPKCIHVRRDREPNPRRGQDRRRVRSEDSDPI